MTSSLRQVSFTRLSIDDSKNNGIVEPLASAYSVAGGRWIVSGATHVQNTPSRLWCFSATGTGNAGLGGTQLPVPDLICRALKHALIIWLGQLHIPDRATDCLALY